MQAERALTICHAEADLFRANAQRRVIAGQVVALCVENRICDLNTPEIAALAQHPPRQDVFHASELRDEGVDGLAEYFRHGADLQDFAAIHDRHAIRQEGGVRLIVAHENCGRTRLAQERLQFVAQRIARARIERRERLVEQEKVGLRRQAARQGHSLFFAGTEILRIAIGQMRDAELRQQFADAARSLRTCDAAARVKPQGNIAGDREVGKQAEVLEHQPDSPSLGREARHVAVVNEDASARRAVKPRDHFQTDRLAGAVRAEQHHDLACVEFEVDGAQREPTERQAGAFDREHGARHRPTPAKSAPRRAMWRNRMKSASDTTSSSNAMPDASSRPDCRNSS